MFVLCPHCQFLVAVDPVTGQPPAHCPRCDAAIAPEHVASLQTPDETVDIASSGGDVDNAAQPPQSASGARGEAIRVARAPEPVHGSIGLPAVDGDAVENVTDAAVPETPDATPDATPAISQDTPAAATPMPARSRAPGFARALRKDGTSHAHRHWRMPLAIIALALVLALQMLLADRARLAADARWRPTLATLCGVLGCDLPPWHEPTAFTLVDRDVRPDPGRPGVLHVSARFRNDARWPQAWPQVLLTLSDVDGRVAGARLFSPREYDARAATRKPIASGQVADIAMDVIEPAPDIVAFTFDFR
jgi:hypothetical protein